MDITEFEILMDQSDITLKDGKHVVFEPLSYKAEKAINKIIKDNKLENLSADDFQALYKKFQPLYQARKRIKQQKAEQFSALSTQEVADLPLEKKLEYMEILFPTNMKRGELEELLKKNEANIRACLFNIDFPQSFWEEEKKLAERYASLIASDLDITYEMKNWQNTSLSDKQFIIQQAGKAFKYVYGTPIDIAFFTEEEERARKQAMGFSKDVHINAAYYKDGKLHFNLDRLKDSDNYYAVSVLFHEATHLRQDFETFKDPLVERIFNSNLNLAALYDDMINDKKSPTFKDFYAMQPNETHAHGLQEYVEQLIAEKTGIEKTHYTDLGYEVKNVHNKAFSMAKLTQYRSSQK